MISLQQAAGKILEWLVIYDAWIIITEWAGETKCRENTGWMTAGPILKNNYYVVCFKRVCVRFARERRVEKCPVVFSGTWLYGNRLHHRRVSSRVVIFVLYEFCTTLFIVICRVACLPLTKHVHRRFPQFRHVNPCVAGYC